MLKDADANADYTPLSEHFQPQWLKSYCGVASKVAVLTSLGETTSQLEFVTSDTAAVRSRWRVTFTGMTLDALGGLIAAHGAKVAVHHADSFDLQTFRHAISRNLSQSDDFLIVNYDRALLGQIPKGHISPLSAYDRDTDMVLIMDTAYKYPPTWVPVEMLYAAMQTIDPESKKFRGYLEVAGPRATGPGSS